MSVCSTRGARVLALLSLFILGSAKAAPLYWDTNGAAVYSGNAGGIWGTDAFWSTNANGLTATGAYVTDSDVVFAAGTDGTGTYTVTLGSNQTATSLNFQEGHVTLAPASTATFASTQVLTLSGTTPAVNVQNMDSVITSRLTSSGLTKNGLGKLTLNYGASGNGSYFDLGTGVITVNAGTLELAGTGGSANQLNAGAGIVVNSGATFLWGSGVNNISDSTRITVNTGGTMVTRVNDQIGTVAGNGLISVQGGLLNLAIGASVTVFSGIITGNGNIQFNGGTGSLTLTNANTFLGNITVQAPNTSVGSIRLAHNRAAQNATLKLPTYSTATSNFTFATGIGTFVVGALGGTLTEGIADLVLQDTAGAAITLQAGNNDTSTLYRGTLKGSGGLTKIGTGTLTLTGETIVVTSTPTAGGTTTVLNSTDLTSTHTYTGDTTILGGTHSNSAINSTSASTLKLDFNALALSSVVSGTNTIVTTGTAATTNIISSASRLVLGGGRLLVAGHNGGNAVSQTFNNTLLTTSRSYVTVTPGTTAGDTVVNLGNITREVGTILEFTMPAGTQSATNGITTTTANDASGILGGWALVGTDWAVKSTAGTAIGNVVAAGAGVYTTYAGGDVAGSAITNLLVNEATTALTTPGGITDLNTLMVRNNGASTVNRTLDIATGETLRLGVTGSLWNQGTGTLVVGTAANTGTLTAGGAANTAGELILNNQAGAGEMTINSRITDNGSGAVTLIRTGSGGQVVLAAANTHTGGSIFTQGRTVATNAGALGTGAVTVTPGGQLWLNASGTYANNFFIAGTGYGEGGVPGAIRVGGAATFTGTMTLTGDARLGGVNGGNATLTGKITGDYALDLSGYTGSLNVITLSNAGNDFTGNLSLNTNLNATSVFNAGGVLTVRLGASEVIPNGLGKGNVVMSGGTGTVTLDLNGFDETINSLISYTHTNLFITNAKAGTTSTLTLGDNNSSTLAASNALYSTFFGGVIRDTGTGIMALTKIGEGTQTFTGANTYSGTTTIRKGILMAGAANTLSANSAVVIASDATAMLALTNGIADFSQTIKSLSGGGTVNLGTIAAADTVASPATRLTTGDSTDTTYSGTIVGGGGLVKQGTGRFTLTGANTYVGTTQVTAGNLQVGAGGSGQSGTGAMSVSSGATLSGSGLVQGATTINGLISAGDTGGTGIGKLTFTDVSTSSLTLAGGGSSVAPRALFTLAGATGSEANPVDGIQTTGLLNGSFGNHDALEVQGTLNLTAGSTIKVELGSGYSPSWGDVFNLIDWGTVSGGSGAIVAGGFNAAATGGDLDLQVSSMMLANGWFWNTDQFLSDGIIFVVPEPGRAMLLMIGLGLVAGRRRRGR